MMLPAGLFWFAWTSREDIYWILPILATVLFGAGNLLVFCSAMLYMTDTYGPLGGASAAAVASVTHKRDQGACCTVYLV